MFDRLFLPHKRVVLAVSGGVDSMAMMYLASAWRSSHGGHGCDLSVVSIDHQLRAEAAAEAAFVKANAKELGLAHTTLVWEGEKPQSRLQETARAARHQLFKHHLESNGFDAIALAHTRDDQAETLLMRLARGSGVDGLGAMREHVVLDSITLLRPLLGVSKACLASTLTSLGVCWVEDASNHKQEFERVRLRRLKQDFAAAGLSDEKLALSARRLGRARDALEEFATKSVRDAGNNFLQHTLGYVEFSWEWLMSLPEDIRLRIISRVARAIGGGDQPVSLSALEGMTTDFNWRTLTGRTLAGTVFSHGKAAGGILATREYGRREHKSREFRLAAGQNGIWDGRFQVSHNFAGGTDCLVKAVGEEGLEFLNSANVPKLGHPAAAVRNIPGIYLGNALVAVPLLGYRAADIPSDAFACQFRAWPFP